MEKLIQASDKIPIFTLGFLKPIWNTKTNYNALKEFVIPDLLEDETLRKRHYKMYSRLHNVVRTAANSSHKTVSDLTYAHSVVWYSNQSEVVVGKGGMFAVVDSTPRLKPFRQMLSLFGKFKPAKPHNSMSFFTARIVWYVDKNFFAGIFVTGLKSMIESGIYEWWYENGYIQKPLLEYCASFKKKYKRHHKLIGDEFEATTIEQVRVPVNLLLGMLLGSLAVFLYETRCRLQALVRWTVARVSNCLKNITQFKRSSMRVVSLIFNRFWEFIPP